MNATGDSLAKITQAVGEVLEGLVIRHQKRCETEAENVRIKGYWVGDNVRIDIVTKADAAVAKA